MKITTAKDILQLKQTHNLNLFEIALKYEVSNSDSDQEVILETMARQWQIMEQAISQGLDPDNQHLHGKILGREAIQLKASFDSGNSICGITTSKAMMYALSTMEVNMAMGQIVAAPTAGASGVLPGTLKALQEAHHLEEKTIIEALFVAGLVGMIIAKQASISGAKGGCQAEIGSAAAMAAAATVYVLDGTMEQSFDAAAIAINNMMGLICDPVAGLVEVPCHKRNALGAANALLCAEMVLAGLPSVIPFDEVVQAMKQVGDLLPACHRETATGGIAISKTAKSIEARIMNDE
jgi:L-serine dehydratase